MDEKDFGSVDIFQSTPPARGATHTYSGQNRIANISIHAPREGGDHRSPFAPQANRLFQSTPPARGATPVLVLVRYFLLISIHAPREGGDSKDAQFYLRIFDKQVELLHFLGKIRGGCLRNPEKDRRFLGKSLANLPAISGHLDFAGGREGASRIPVRRTTAAPGGVRQRIRGSSGR